MIRAVFDTNVLVSALLKPGASESSVVEAAAVGKLIPCLSPAVLAEYRDVLHRPRFRFETRDVRAFLRALMEVSVFVSPAAALSVCPDPDDDRFLECAEAAGAHYLITGNKRHFPAQWLGTRVVSAREMLALLP
jgi:putative PIN family toxin of toxin-antitoxin system